MGFSSLDDVLKKRTIRRNDPLSIVSAVQNIQLVINTYKNGLFLKHCEVISVSDVVVKVKFDSSVYSDRFRKEEHSIKKLISDSTLSFHHVIG